MGTERGSCSKEVLMPGGRFLSPTTNYVFGTLSDIIIRNKQDEYPKIFPYDSSQSRPSCSGAAKFSSDETIATPPPSAALNVTPNLTNTDWSPVDDGIDVKLPSSIDKTPSIQAVEEHIQRVLYGPVKRKRLPVFVDICPGNAWFLPNTSA